MVYARKHIIQTRHSLYMSLKINEGLIQITIKTFKDMGFTEIEKYARVPYHLRCI